MRYHGFNKFPDSLLDEVLLMHQKKFNNPNFKDAFPYTY